MLSDSLAARRTLLLQLLFLFNNYAAVQPSFDVSIVNATGIYDKSALKYFNLSLYAFENRNVLKLDFELRRTMPNFKMHLKARSPGSSKFAGSSINSVLDGCRVLSMRNSRNIVINGVLMVLQRGNVVMPKQCPVKAHKRYSVDRFDVPSDVFPPFLPTLTVFTNFSIVAQNKLIFSSILRIECVRK